MQGACHVAPVTALLSQQCAASRMSTCAYNDPRDSHALQKAGCLKPGYSRCSAVESTALCQRWRRGARTEAAHAASSARTVACSWLTKLRMCALGAASIAP